MGNIITRSSIGVRQFGYAARGKPVASSFGAVFPDLGQGPAQREVHRRPRSSASGRREIVQALQDACEVAAVTEVLPDLVRPAPKTGVSSSAIVGRHRKLPLQVLLDLHLRQALLGLLLLGEDDAPSSLGAPQDSHRPARRRRYAAIHIGGTLGGDRAQLDGHPTLALLRMRQRVRVAPDTAELRSTAAWIAAFEA